MYSYPKVKGLFKFERDMAGFVFSSLCFSCHWGLLHCSFGSMSQKNSAGSLGVVSGSLGVASGSLGVASWSLGVESWSLGVA